MPGTLKQVRILLQPSWLSGLVAATVGAGVVITTLIISNYQGSALQQELFEAKSGHATTSVLGFQTITDNLAANAVISNLPLFLFWAVLGVIVYMFAASLWEALSKAEELREELDYVNAPRRALVRETVGSLLLRLACLGLWIGYSELFLKLIVPYALAAAHIAAVGLASPSGIGYAVLSFVIICAAIQVHTVFLRLVWLRLRLFGGLYAGAAH